MRLVPFAPDMAVGVAACYNDLIAPVPECHPVLPEAGPCGGNYALPPLWS